MAWAFKLILRWQPARGTSQMGAFREYGIETGLFPHNPDPKFLFEFFIDLTQDKILGITCFKSLGWFKEYSGESGPNKTQESHKAEKSKATPPQTGKEVASGPNAPPNFFFNLLLFSGHGLNLTECFLF
jgi:hypothetical protein